jgi:hypothetical protein
LKTGGTAVESTLHLASPGMCVITCPRGSVRGSARSSAPRGRTPANPDALASTPTADSRPPTTARALRVDLVLQPRALPDDVRPARDLGAQRLGRRPGPGGACADAAPPRSPSSRQIRCTRLRLISQPCSRRRWCARRYPHRGRSAEIFRSSAKLIDDKRFLRPDPTNRLSRSRSRERHPHIPYPFRLRRRPIAPRPRHAVHGDAVQRRRRGPRHG